MAGHSDDLAVADGTITARYERLCEAGALDERGRRLWAAGEARAGGRGGVAAVARATGLSESTVRRGLRELARDEVLVPGRVRRAGAGRTPVAERDPTLIEDLERLIDPVGRGSEQSPLRWTCKSGAKLAAALRERDHRVVDRTVLRLLRARGYSLQGNRQARDDARHPDRNAQFEFVSRTASAAIAASEPMISVELKRRDQVRWSQIGITSETARLAAGAISRWWERLGTRLYPRPATLTIVADSGELGSDRTRAWTVELQALSDACGLELTICHFPAGTTRWDGVEHRLLSFSPSLGFEAVITLVGEGTMPAPTYVWLGGPEQPAAPDANSVNLLPAVYEGDWNYRIRPFRRRP
jgi:hypothetical protein